MPYTCVGYVVMLGSRRWRYGGHALVVCGVASVASRGALAGGVRAPSATEARRRVDPGNARRRPVGWRRRRARARGGAALLALAAALLAVLPRRRWRQKAQKPRVSNLSPILLSAAVSPLVARRDSK